MELTAKKVSKVFEECLFKDSEIVNGKPIIEPARGEGVLANFGFHPERLKSHKDTIKALLAELPDQFFVDKGGGWSFLQACCDKSGYQWGEHRNMEQLFALGNAAGFCKFCLPKEMWKIMPGGMPYITIDFKEFKDE